MQQDATRAVENKARKMKKGVSNVEIRKNRMSQSSFRARGQTEKNLELKAITSISSISFRMFFPLLFSLACYEVELSFKHGSTYLVSLSALSVIPTTTFRVVQFLVGFLDSTEIVHRIWVFRLVRVMLESHFLVCFLNFACRCLDRDT